MRLETDKAAPCCSKASGQCAAPAPHSGGGSSWTKRYLAGMALFALAWAGAYVCIEPAARWISGALFSHSPALEGAVAFFLYDTAKILLLLVAMIYALAWVRASLNVERVRDYLAGKGRLAGYIMGAVFGAVTPFCSCSSIPLFLGFTTARIPVGITMAFLITSPLINEIAVVLLWGLLGWKFTLVYVGIGLLAGIVGGLFMDAIRAGRWLQPFILEAMNSGPAVQSGQEQGGRLSLRQRHDFAYGETRSIFMRIWKWVLIGVGVGAALHGYVPANWFAENLGAGEWWSVPAAVLVGIPLYSNVAGIIPVMESLLLKGMPLGTTLAFCMSSVAASLPEVLLLRQIMTAKMQVAFIGYLWAAFTLVGWLFNFLAPSLL